MCRGGSVMNCKCGSNVVLMEKIKQGVYTQKCFDCGAGLKILYLDDNKVETQNPMKREENPEVKR